MAKFNDTPVLPRPVEALPEYAHAAARKTLADKLTEAFGLSRGAATAIANAVVDPSSVRKSIGEPSDPNAERIAVPGGELLGIRTPVWARKAMPDARNPRTLPSRRHPFAIDPGTGKEDSKFRPVPEPRTPDGVPRSTAELAVDIESRHHLVWASEQAKSYVLANNDWRESIRTQGVMEAVWLVATTYRHADDSDPVTALTSAEGSSRLTADHDILGIRSADIPYEDADAKFRAHIRRLNDAFQAGEASPEDLAVMRCERVPALVIVGFVPHDAGQTGFATGFPTALKSLVALRHVDPPTPWGEGPENESLADEVLDELERRKLITPTQAAYYAGSVTKEEARAAHLSDDPARRAADIVRLLTNPEPHVREAIRIAVTSQSTRKNVNQGLLNSLATALILRAVVEDPARHDQVRRYLRKGFGKAVHTGDWAPTGRDTDALAAAALDEVRAAMTAGRADEPGPSTLELAVRSALPLVLDGRLSGDRGTANNQQPDRRTPAEVLEAMRQTPQGVQQLAQALRDHAAGRPIRAVDELGVVALNQDGSERIVNDTYLRGEFPPPGKSKSQRPGDTPADRFHNSTAVLAAAMDAVAAAFEALGNVVSDDGRPMVDVKGVDARDCKAWRDLLDRMDEEFVVWSRTFRRVHGVDSTPPTPAATELDDVDDENDSPDAEQDILDEAE
ncbi:hypothetical protein XH98_28450 [Bradyrhizobium sp. CCBAU 51745]|uniref:hypothetical protein n=1 Tax=Bradyrhizobium sp. CCBAU 51745 TaxID=1325099 RepID=UPI0023054B68|nr:hypothetical protein [Bradyrhizobium sp. CCBAU 51745]MDA9442957.1 hypothetical protein [Bradyrhizobium sp. CCBAU 51745]